MDGVMRGELLERMGALERTVRPVPAGQLGV